MTHARPASREPAQHAPIATSPQDHGCRACDVDRVAPQILWSFADLVVALGGDADALLARAGIDPQAFHRGRATIGYRQMVDLVAGAAAHLGCPDFGMRLATLQAGAIQSPLMRILHNSGTLGEAWEAVTRHSYAHSLAASFRLSHCASDETLMLGHDILLEGLADKRQATEQILLVVLLSCRAATAGALRARRVDFRHQPLSPPRTYRRYFGCDVRFGQPSDGIVYGESALHCPIAAPDPLVRNLAVAGLDAAFPHRKPPLSVTVRGLVMRLLASARCTNDGVAAILSLHPRTLHRRLRDEGTSFQRIKNEVRRDMLAPYLDQTDLPMSEISERLGFSEQSALTRFCRAWLGQSPSARRRDRLA